MFAKRFFYVCAGLFLLALTYHLGARNATAQAGATAFGLNHRGDLTCAVGRAVHVLSVNGWRATVEGVPGTSPIVVTSESGGGEAHVGLENGDLYFNQYMSNQAGWTYVGNLFGPTAVQQETWGAMKSRYRGERGAAQPATQDR